MQQRTQQASAMEVGIWESGGRPKGCWGRGPTLGCAPIGLNSIHSPSGQNMTRAHPDRFCMPHCFDVYRGIGWCSDVRPDPLERLSSYLSIHTKNVQNGVHMWSRWWFWCGLFLESESTFPNRIRLGFLVSTTSNVMTWWKRREHLDLVPNPCVS
jgi:hypothetical protein